MEFFNDRRPSPTREGDDDRLLDHAALTEANAQIRAATPAYRMREVNTKIRTTAVQRFRAREAGGEDFKTVGEYVNFITGTDDGCY